MRLVSYYCDGLKVEWFATTESGIYGELSSCCSLRRKAIPRRVPWRQVACRTNETFHPREPWPTRALGTFDRAT